MKRITNRIYCEEVHGQASGEVMVRGNFTKWEIEARVEAKYEEKFGGLWYAELGEPEVFQECPGCTIYEVLAKRVITVSDYIPTPPPKLPPSDDPQTPADGPEQDVALSAIGVANAAVMASQAALTGHPEDVRTYVQMIERNMSKLRTAMFGLPTTATPTQTQP